MASRGKHVQLDHMYTADFETCDTWPQEHGDSYPDQRVWLAGWRNLETGQVQMYNSLDGFMLSILGRGDNQNTEYAFHNLKFDGSYIVPWLLRNGYTVTQEKPQEREFSVLIDNNNNWYTIQIQATKRRRVLLWDSLKLFPSPLEYLPELYGTPTQKLHEDQDFYTMIRPEGHQATAEEESYLYNDLTVLAETLNAHIKLYGLLFKKTQAGQSFWNFEQAFPAWKFRFPPLDIEVDTLIRKSYWGGISYAAEQHAGKDQYGIHVYDINSSYPYQLAHKKMPYGPVQYTWKGQHPDMSKFWVAEAWVRFTLKPGKVPCIMKKGIIENKPITLDSWLKSSDGVVRMVFCSIDYLTIFQSYDFEVIQWGMSWHWAQKIQKEVQAFILKNNEDKVKYKNLAKCETDPFLKAEYMAHSQRAKINNNSFYGKFGEEVIKKGKTPHMVDDDVVYLIDREDIATERRRKFLPLAIATTAWGRNQLVTMANELGEDFLYCDTDSIHLRMTGAGKIEEAVKAGKFVVDPVALGGWKFEGQFDRGRYLRAKAYYEEVYGQVPEVTLAGLPADPHTGPRSKVRSCCTWENFHIGQRIPGGNGRLRTVRTRTGSKLVPVDFNITLHMKFMY